MLKIGNCFKKWYITIFLIISGIILCLFLGLIYTRYKLKEWCDLHSDKSQSGLRVFYYSGEDWSGSHNKTELIQKLSYFDTANKEFQKNNFSLRAIGIFYPPKTGRYKFYLKSDDGSKLYINNNLLIDNSGTHPVIEKNKALFLTRGFHLIFIEYFQAMGKAELQFKWKIAGQTKTDNLGQFFYPVTSNFKWEVDVDEFMRIVNQNRYLLIWILAVICILSFTYLFYIFLKKIWMIIGEIILTRFKLFKKNIFNWLKIMLDVFRGAFNLLKNHCCAFKRKYLADKTKVILSVSIFLSIFATLWFIFHLPSNPPSMKDSHRAYVDTTNMYIYFCLLLLALYKSQVKENIKTFSFLAVILFAYPFFFIYSRYAGTLDPITNCFPYFKTILYAKERSWQYILSHPWGAYWEDAETRFLNNHAAYSALEPLAKSKMPGVAYTTKILSYIVFDKWTFVVAIVCLTILAYVLCAKAFYPALRDRRWSVVYMFAIPTFLFQPWGAENMALIYFALCIYSLYRFKQKGNTCWLLAGLVSATLMFMAAVASLFLIPFIVSYAFIGNKNFKKLLIIGPFCLMVVYFLVSAYFRKILGIPLLQHYCARVELGRSGFFMDNWFYRIKVSLSITWMIYGPFFILCIISLFYKPKRDISILMIASLMPVLVHNWGFVPSESYRQLHLSCVASFLVFLAYIHSFNGDRNYEYRKLYLQILTATSVLYAIMFHRLYLVPEYVLNPLSGDSPPADFGDGIGNWSLGCLGYQNITPIYFIILFAVWVCFLIIRKKNLLQK